MANSFTLIFLVRTVVERKLDIERGSTRSHPVSNSLWKRQWTCRKTDDRVKCIYENLWKRFLPLIYFKWNILTL
jgi:hypothetical protein